MNQKAAITIAQSAPADNVAQSSTSAYDKALAMRTRVMGKAFVTAALANASPFT